MILIRITEGSSSNQVTYTFTRTGEVTAALTVEFTVTGTAKFKEDYSLTGADEGFDGSKGKITFKTGEKTAKVTLDISDDSDTEENETIALSLVETSEYMVSQMDVAMGTVTITSDDIETIVDEKPDVSIGDDNDNDSDDDQVDFSLISKTKQTFKFKSKFKNGKSSIKFSFKSKSVKEFQEIGFFTVDDEDGGIDTDGDGTADILVGDAGYAQAAVQNRIASIDLSVENQSTATFEGEFQAGSIFVPFLIVDGTVDNFNEVFFPFLGANSDGVDHVMMLGDNLFGFEDLPGGGDRDFNDIIVKIDFSVRST